MHPNRAQFLFGEPLAKDLDAELAGVDEIFHLSLTFFICHCRLDKLPCLKNR